MRQDGLNSKLMLSSILISPSLLISGLSDKQRSSVFDSTIINQLTSVLDKSHLRYNDYLEYKLSQQAKALQDSVPRALEAYYQILISNCAQRIGIPSNLDLFWSRPENIQKNLSPTVKKRIKFVDKGESIWNSIIEYTKPIFNNPKKIPPELFKDPLDIIFWNFYLLALSSNSFNEVLIDINWTLKLIRWIRSVGVLSNEANARLSNLEGVFNLYDNHSRIPGFSIIRDNSTFPLSERIDEILEDAWLLEASSLRRFFSVEVNKASIKRDLRKIIKFIVKNRPWAKGITIPFSYSGIITNSNAEFIDKISQCIQGSSIKSSPVILDTSFLNTHDLVIGYKRLCNKPQIIINSYNVN